MWVLKCHAGAKWRGIESVSHESVLNVMKYSSVGITLLPAAVLSACLTQLLELVFNLQFYCNCGEYKSFSVRMSMVF